MIWFTRQEPNVLLMSSKTCLFFDCHSLYEVWHTQKKKTNQEWEGRDKQTAIEHVLACHSVTRLSSIALLSTSGRIFKYRLVLILGRKMSYNYCLFFYFFMNKLEYSILLATRVCSSQFYFDTNISSRLNSCIKLNVFHPEVLSKEILEYYM
jgi:hypothetical protein